MEQVDNLGHESIIRLLMRFSVPAIVGMLVNALYNVVVRIFVGNGVGSLGIAGIAVTFPSVSRWWVPNVSKQWAGLVKRPF